MSFEPLDPRENDAPNRQIAAVEPRRRWWDWLVWPREVISDIQADVAFLRRGALEINDRLKNMEAEVLTLVALIAAQPRGSVDSGGPTPPEASVAHARDYAGD